MKRFLSLFFLFGIFAGISAQNSDLIISEYVEGWSNNKALEIYNPTQNTLDLSEYRLIRYSNGADVPPPQANWTVELPQVYLEPYHTYVIVIDQRDPNGTDQDAPIWKQLEQRADTFLCKDYEVSEVMYFNGDDAIVIERNEGGGAWSIQDIFGRWGAPAPALAQFAGSSKIDNAWTNISPFFTGEGIAITAEHTMIRKSNVIDGIVSNPSIFNPLAEYDTLPANTFDHLGWHKFDNAPANQTPVPEKTNYKFAVSPSATNETVIGTIAATDAEQDPLKYFIDYNNFVYINNIRYEPFKLEKETGILKVADASGLKPEVLDTFYLKVTITDRFSQTDPMTVMVIVTDDDINTKVNSTGMNPLRLYPNPAIDNQFEVQDSKSFREIRVFNLLGRQIYYDQFSTAVYKRNVRLESADKGIYMVSVRYSDGSSKVQKLVVK